MRNTFHFLSDCVYQIYQRAHIISKTQLKITYFLKCMFRSHEPPRLYADCKRNFRYIFILRLNEKTFFSFKHSVHSKCKLFYLMTKI